MKKAQEEIMFVFSLILISLVLTLAFITFSIAGKGKVTEKIDALKTNEININLLNYLRTKDTKTNYTLAELITYSYYKGNYDDVNDFIKNLFNKYHDKQKCPILFINTFSTKDNQKLFESLSLGEANDYVPRYSTSIKIPTFDKDNDIKVNYLEGCKNE